MHSGWLYLYHNLSYSLDSIFFNAYMVVFLSNTVIYVYRVIQQDGLKEPVPVVGGMA